MYKIIFDNEAELLKNITVYIILGVEFLANIATKNNTCIIIRISFLTSIALTNNTINTTCIMNNSTLFKVYFVLFTGVC